MVVHANIFIQDVFKSWFSFVVNPFVVSNWPPIMMERKREWSVFSSYWSQMLLPTRQQTRTKLSKVNEYSTVVEQLDYRAKPFILKYNPVCFHIKINHIESESASHSNTWCTAGWNGTVSRVMGKIKVPLTKNVWNLDFCLKFLNISVFLLVGTIFTFKSHV